MYINEECLKITKITALEYLSWCKKANKKPSDINSKREFFKLIREGHIYRNRKTRKIIYKGKEIND